MRLYTPEQEERIGVQALVREWARSKPLDPFSWRGSNAISRQISGDVMKILYRQSGHRLRACHGLRGFHIDHHVSVVAVRVSGVPVRPKGSHSGPVNRHGNPNRLNPG